MNKNNFLKGCYILVNRRPVFEPDTSKWAKWFGKGSNRRVARDIVGKKTISTVFLGMDYNFTGKKKPLLFETMVFGQDEEYMERYSTWQEAKEGHKKILKKYQNENNT